jgi:hypothetical protein
MGCPLRRDQSCYQRGRIAERLLRSTSGGEKVGVCEAEPASLAAMFATAQPCGLLSTSYATYSQQADKQAGWLGCGRRLSPRPWARLWGRSKRRSTIGSTATAYLAW